MSIADIDVDLNAGIVRRKLDLPFWSFLSTRYQGGGMGKLLGVAIPAAAQRRRPTDRPTPMAGQLAAPTARPIPNDDMTFPARVHELCDS